jgi:CheY-like chemotaxis protein
MKTRYVEDDPNLREIVAFAVGLEPVIDLRSYSSRAAALAALEADPAWSPNGLFLDVMMPGMDGVATLREIRCRWPHAEAPAISISAKRDPPLVNLDPHAAGFVEKPFDPLALGGRLLQLFSGAVARPLDGPREAAWPGPATHTLRSA